MTAFPAPRATRPRVSPTTRARACVSISECCRARSWAWTLTRSIGPGRRRCFAIELGFAVEDHAFSADQEAVCLRLGNRFDVTQLAGDGGAFPAGILERLSNRIQAFFGLRQQLSELAELGLDGAQPPPHLGRATFDRSEERR